MDYSVKVQMSVAAPTMLFIWEKEYLYPVNTQVFPNEQPLGQECTTQVSSIFAQMSLPAGWGIRLPLTCSLQYITTWVSNYRMQVKYGMESCHRTSHCLCLDTAERWEKASDLLRRWATFNRDILYFSFLAILNRCSLWVCWDYYILQCWALQHSFNSQAIKCSLCGDCLIISKHRWYKGTGDFSEEGLSLFSQVRCNGIQGNNLK